MANLSRQQVEEIIRNAPAGTTPEGVVAALRKAGHTLEGYQEVKTTTKKPPLEETQPIIDPITGLIKSGGRTLLGIGTMGRTAQEGLARLIGKDLPETSVFDIGSERRQAAEEVLRPKSRGEQVGTFVGDVATAAIPSTGAARATQGVGFGKMLLARGGTGALTGMIQGGGDFDRDVAVGAAAEVAIPILGRAFKYGGQALKGLASFATGKTDEVITQVLRSPEAAKEGIERVSVEGLEESAKNIRLGVKELKKKFGAEFAEGMAPHSTKKISKPALLNKVDDFFATQVDLDTIVDDGVKTLDLDASRFVGPEATRLSRAYSLVQNWTDDSAEGMSKLASKLSKFYSGADDAAEFDRAIIGLKNVVRDHVSNEVPEVAEVVARYADGMDLLDQTEALLKTKGAVTSRIGIQKTSENIARLFNSNKELARKGVEEIEKELGMDVLGREAGRQLASPLTRAQTSLGDITRGAIQVVVPPDLVAKAVATTGQAQQVIQNTLGRLDVLEPAARGLVYEILLDLFGTEENQ